VRIAALLAAASLAVVLAAPHLAAAPAPPKPVERIVYTSGGDIWSVAPDGRGRQRLTRTAAAEAFPRLSPDGTRLAFVRDGRLLVGTPEAKAARAVTVDGQVASRVSWSPDGRRLAVATSSGLWTVAPGGRPQAVPVPLPPLSAAWSPDGARIAFTATDAGANTDVYVVALATGEIARVTEDPAVDAEPAWSPDGTQLAFTSSRDGNPELYVATADGVTETRITSDPRSDTAADWSPDGRRLAAVRDRRVVLLGLDGSLVRDLGGGGAPDWGRLLPAAAEERQRKDELLPDLDPRAPASLSVSTSRGRELLGFTSAVDSVGRGPMWLRGRRTSVRTPLMEARQLVSVRNGGFRVYRRAGSMRYTFSPTHIHWHILDFVRYELRRASDFKLVVRDYKTGFCLGDHYGHAGHRVRVMPPRFNGNCGQGRPDLLEVEQGNSVGYTDRYPSYYHGQYVELTRAPAGLYVLVHRANPRRLLRELDYENNASSVLIRLRRQGGRPSIRVLRVCQRTDRCLPAG
jgi:hypothetical protein